MNTHWDRLRKFGSSRLVQSTVAIPVLGYVILFNAELAKYFSLYFENYDPDAIPDRLYWLYYGFVLLTCGSILFAVRCPAEVKHHGAAYDFVDKQKAIMHDAREASMREKLLVNFFKFSYPDCQYDFVTAAAHPDDPDGKSDRDLLVIRNGIWKVRQQFEEKTKEEVMRDYFEILEESRPVARWLTYSFFAAGVAALAVPSIETLIRVTESLIQRIS